ncbi:hypothetical protein [Idiomarina aminovorans]|uniref:hypothetical protein n=1 Tax=Idiomarina aminovorans TaxID=2914829 RepID=UPI0020035143|nr:hypothetical protein [Idiomarina sp. ATCH4]MCK7458842.1 hypothetical protein [Idiomarina sp. ATCH4]
MRKFFYFSFSVIILVVIASLVFFGFSDQKSKVQSANDDINKIVELHREAAKQEFDKDHSSLNSSIERIDELVLQRDMDRDMAVINACQHLRSQPKVLTETTSLITADKLLRRCRRYMNLQHAKQPQWDDYIAARQLLKQQGWQAVINQLQQGQISSDANLLADQSMGLHYLFAANGVNDVRAYQQLSNHGVRFNDKALEVALVRSPSLVTILLQLDPAASAHDMGYSPATLAAAYQRPALALQLVAQGYDVIDSLDRDLLASAMSSHNPLITPTAWLKAIEAGDIGVNETHRQLLPVAKQKDWPASLINAIEQRLPGAQATIMLNENSDGSFNRE